MNKNKVLLVYYSKSGITKRLGDLLAELVPCETEEIVESGERQGFIGMVRSAIEAVAGTAPEIEPTHKDPAQYSLVIIGTPVWMNNVATPVRTYLLKKGDAFNNVAFFATSDGTRSNHVFSQMRRICGKVPVAHIHLKRDEIEKASHLGKVRSFISKITHSVERPEEPSTLREKRIAS